MIVLDDNLDAPDVEPAIRKWYRGPVLFMRTLRPGTIIKDESIPKLLTQRRQPTFITNNVSDFWRRVPADGRYCIVCFPISNERQGEIPELLRRLFRLSEFKTKAARMGKVARAGKAVVQYYRFDNIIRLLAWIEEPIP